MGRGRSGIVNGDCELSRELVARMSVVCVGAVKQSLAIMHAF